MLTYTHRALSLLAMLAFTTPGWAKLQAASDDITVCPAGQSVLVDVLVNDTGLGDDLRILNVHKPNHGKTAIENGRIRYTPTPGFQGSDTFTYKVQAAKSKPGEATVNVEVGQGGVVLRMVGQVVDAPIPNATVTVSIGGIDFTTHADANGNYVLDIAALRGDAFVTLTATGTSPSGAAVRFYSVAGEIARLATAAGSDGVLVRNEFNQVNITNLSTAQYTLLADANGGQPVGSDQQLTPLTQNIDLDQMLQLAAIIKLVVDDNVPLPAGSTDALALISDPAAVEAFKASLAPDQLADAVSAVTSDPALTPAFRSGALPTGYATISPSAPGTIRAGITNGVLIHFDGSATATSGSGSTIDYDPGSTPPMSWQLLGGDLVVTPVATFTTDWYEDFPVPPQCDGTAYYFTRDTEQKFKLTRLQDGPGLDYLKVTSTVLREHQDLDPGDGCVPPADGVVDFSYVRLGFEDGQGELPFTANEALGRIALSHIQPGVFPHATGFQNWAAAVLDFNNHSVDIPGTDPAFASSIANGRLYVQLTNSTTHQATQYEYRRYQLDGSLGEGIFTIATLPDGNLVSTYDLASRQNNGATFDTVSLPGRWRSGFDASQIQGDGSVPIGFNLVFNNDVAQTGIYDSVDPFGVELFSNPYTWGVEGGNMVARSYRNMPYGPQPSCSVPAVGSFCWLRRTRTWTPLSFTADGSRVYVLERIFDAPSGGAPVELGAERVNFYDRN